ncbi:MAG: chemotaxis protein CheW [Planctomycetota bacterium]|nr:chemotaxis protein CheW [Planctomycetota bacterium]
MEEQQTPSSDAPMDDIVQALRKEYWESLEEDREGKARDVLQYISFSISGQTYAIPIGQVKEVTLLPAVSQLPRSPEHLSGVINLRGRIVAVMDLRPLLKLQGREILKGCRVLIVAGQGHELGLIVQQVHGILAVEPADIRLRPQRERAQEDPYLAGQLETTDRVTLLLDTEKLLVEEASRIRTGHT